MTVFVAMSGIWNIAVKGKLFRGAFLIAFLNLVEQTFTFSFHRCETASYGCIGRCVYFMEILFYGFSDSNGLWIRKNSRKTKYCLCGFRRLWDQLWDWNNWVAMAIRSWHCSLGLLIDVNHNGPDSKMNMSHLLLMHKKISWTTTAQISHLGRYIFFSLRVPGVLKSYIPLHHGDE